MLFHFRDAFLAIVALQSTFGFLYINGLAGKLISIHNPEYAETSSSEDADSPPLPALEKRVASFAQNKRTPNATRFTPVPARVRGTFWIDDHGSSKPIRRGFEARGWRYVTSHERAHVVYSCNARKDLWTTLGPYQRHNHIPGYVEWDKKDRFNQRMMSYKKSLGKQVWSVPKTFSLNSLKRRESFRKVLFEQGGLSRPWVLKVPNLNKGKGITMLGPNTEALKNVLDKVENDKKKNYIVR
jgi:hypothetical protein